MGTESTVQNNVWEIVDIKFHVKIKSNKLRQNSKMFLKLVSLLVFFFVLDFIENQIMCNIKSSSLWDYCLFSFTHIKYFSKIARSTRELSLPLFNSCYPAFSEILCFYHLWGPIFSHFAYNYCKCWFSVALRLTFLFQIICGLTLRNK